MQFDLAGLDRGGPINLMYKKWQLTEFKVDFLASRVCCINLISSVQDATDNAQQLTDPKHDGWAVCLLSRPNHHAGASI